MFVVRQVSSSGISKLAVGARVDYLCFGSSLVGFSSFISFLILPFSCMSVLVNR